MRAWQVFFEFLKCRPIRSPELMFFFWLKKKMKLIISELFFILFKHLLNYLLIKRKYSSSFQFFNNVISKIFQIFAKDETSAFFCRPHYFYEYIRLKICVMKKWNVSKYYYILKWSNWKLPWTAKLCKDTCPPRIHCEFAFNWGFEKLFSHLRSQPEQWKRCVRREYHQRCAKRWFFFTLWKKGRRGYAYASRSELIVLKFI